MKTIKEWITEIHNNALEKGFWEGERSEAQIFNLIRSELAEATEEARKKIMLVDINFYYSNGKCVVQSFPSDDIIKPEGVFVELVDCAIRILDYLGSIENDIEFYCNYFCKEDSKTIIETIKNMSLDDVIDTTYDSMSHYRKNKSISELFNTIKGLSTYINNNGGDFWKILEIKHEYNKHRPYKHGKRF